MHINQVVGSSNIQGIGYDNGELVVQFKTGSAYKYFNVSSSVYREFEQAESKGSFFAANIKGNYESKKLETSEI